MAIFLKGINTEINIFYTKQKLKNMKKWERISP